MDNDRFALLQHKLRRLLYRLSWGELASAEYKAIATEYAPSLNESEYAHKGVNWFAK